MALEMLLGAAIFAAGMLAGRFWPSRRRAPKPVRPICGCEHHFSYHGSDGGRCNERVYQGTGIYVQCPCRSYTGPQPLPEYYAPEIEG